MTQQWKTFKDMVAEHYSPSQQGRIEQEIPHISNAEQTRQEPKQLDISGFGDLS